MTGQVHLPTSPKTGFSIMLKQHAKIWIHFALNVFCIWTKLSDDVPTHLFLCPFFNDMHKEVSLRSPWQLQLWAGLYSVTCLEMRCLHGYVFKVNLKSKKHKTWPVKQCWALGHVLSGAKTGQSLWSGVDHLTDTKHVLFWVLRLRVTRASPLHCPGK